MGTGIATQVQILTEHGWENVHDDIFTRYDEKTHHPFSEQNYGVFAFPCRCQKLCLRSGTQ
ncbi:Uncharacterised protein [Enterobacter cloacae]|uniref:Uncharacterized protein n=1 Tax=Enterobacter cloacae TaxID=550 RepID=A0A377LN66_ENTCL|nr:Uncharacterised protein [Enterobacter cloacae]